MQGGCALPQCVLPQCAHLAAAGTAALQASGRATCGMGRAPAISQTATSTKVCEWVRPADGAGWANNAIAAGSALPVRLVPLNAGLLAGTLTHHFVAVVLVPLRVQQGSGCVCAAACSYCTCLGPVWFLLVPCLPQASGVPTSGTARACASLRTAASSEVSHAVLPSGK